MTTLLLAMDRASVRRICIDGRLHVASANISKANVCPYRGAEIPNWQSLGLDPDRIYALFRHPEELKRAAPTFNNLPVLDLHIPVTADEPHPDRVVGSTGTDAAFNAPYLTNSLVIWTAPSIQRVESDEQRELSCAYRYEADMTPGEFEGLRYDGIMRNIIGNHVAIVREGRAGPDVVIGDGKLEMPTMLKSRKGLMLNGALAALVRPLLAADAKIDLSAVLTDVTAANMADKSADIATAVVAACAGKLATDAALDIGHVTATIGAVAGVALDSGEIDLIDDEPIVAPPAPAPTVIAAPAAPVVAVDAATIRQSVIAEMNAVRDAERIVRPVIGELDTLPVTAAEVYRLALDAKGITSTGITDATALRAMVEMIPTATPVTSPRIAADSAARSSFAERFPNRSTLIKG